MRFSFDPLSRTFSNPRYIFDKKTLGALGAVHTNPGKFETASFLLESRAFRPQETSESGHRNRIFFKPLSTVVEDPINTIPDKKKICVFKRVRIRVDMTLMLHGTIRNDDDIWRNTALQC